MTNLTLETLENLKANFQANIEWDEEEAFITGTGSEIIEWITEKCKEIAKTENCILETSAHEYPLNFSDDGEFIDFQVQVESNISNENDIIAMFSNYGLDVIFFDYDDEENKSYFTAYISITI